METVHVDLGERSYDIHIGAGLLSQAGGYIRGFTAQKIAVIADETVADLHGQVLLESCAAAGLEVVLKTIPSGETSKSFEQLQDVCDFLLSERLERQSIVVAFGGGVIGDLVGFAAAIVRRGLRFIQIPTTLLAQVDSSVGGKTGINTLHGKNLIGAFHQPSLVLADVSVLQTLEIRDFLAGYGEVAKYGLLGDEAFFEWLERNGPALRDGDEALRIEAITRSCQMKADIVMRDETEQGDRALLNLGHTFCHALEAATGYSDRLLHGEGVAIGCALAFETSARLGLCSQETPSRVRAHFAQMGQKTDLRDIEGDLPSASALVELMYQDKKVSGGAIKFIMARDIGQAFVTKDVDMAVVEHVLSDALAERDLS